jgi:hypothetical protein
MGAEKSDNMRAAMEPKPFSPLVSTEVNARHAAEGPAANALRDHVGDQLQCLKASTRFQRLD